MARLLRMIPVSRRCRISFTSAACVFNKLGATVCLAVFLEFRINTLLSGNRPNERQARAVTVPDQILGKGLPFRSRLAQKKEPWSMATCNKHHAAWPEIRFMLITDAEPEEQLSHNQQQGMTMEAKGQRNIWSSVTSPAKCFRKNSSPSCCGSSSGLSHRQLRTAPPAMATKGAAQSGLSAGPIYR